MFDSFPVWWSVIFTVVYIPIGILPRALSSRVDDTIERERALLREAQRA